MSGVVSLGHWRTVPPLSKTGHGGRGTDSSQSGGWERREDPKILDWTGETHKIHLVAKGGNIRVRAGNTGLKLRRKVRARV